MPETGSYKIDFRNQRDALGEHTYLLDNSFFESLDQQEVKGGQLTATLTLRQRLAGNYDATCTIEGVVTVVCDRCLEDLSLPVQVNETFTLKEASAADDEDDEQRIIPADGIYDIGWELYQLIELSLPVMRVHDVADCNPYFTNRIQREEEEDNPQQQN